MYPASPFDENTDIGGQHVSADTTAEVDDLADTSTEPEAGPGAGSDERLAYRGLGQRMLVRPEIVGIMAAVLLYLFFWGVTAPSATPAAPPPCSTYRPPSGSWPWPWPSS